MERINHVSRSDDFYPNIHTLNLDPVADRHNLFWPTCQDAIRLAVMTILIVRFSQTLGVDHEANVHKLCRPVCQNTIRLAAKTILMYASILDLECRARRELC